MLVYVMFVCTTIEFTIFDLSELPNAKATAIYAAATDGCVRSHACRRDARNGNGAELKI